MKVMVRRAEDDFIAMLTAQAIENWGGTVISIAYNGEATHHGALAPHSRFIVFARARDDDHIDVMDKAIEQALADNNAAR